MPPTAMRLSRDEHDGADGNATQPTILAVSITQAMEDRVRGLEEQFRELDVELRRRFGDVSYSVDRSEQVLGAIQRLRWAIARSPVESPLPAASGSAEQAETD